MLFLQTAVALFAGIISLFLAYDPPDCRSSSCGKELQISTLLNLKKSIIDIFRRAYGAPQIYNRDSDHIQPVPAHSSIPPPCASTVAGYSYTAQVAAVARSASGQAPSPFVRGLSPESEDIFSSAQDTRRIIWMEIPVPRLPSQADAAQHERAKRPQQDSQWRWKKQQQPPRQHQDQEEDERGRAWREERREQKYWEWATYNNLPNDNAGQELPPRTTQDSRSTKMTTTTARLPRENNSTGDRDDYDITKATTTKGLDADGKASRSSLLAAILACMPHGRLDGARLIPLSPPFTLAFVTIRAITR
ncbi:hypothetical protein GLOTRDRAFT_93508 [Gloeophyllum trabeum ATCC 11539]|uniref:Uncharacterized protein n=1 Tax=Gloeophyllum trabeum (strain ATCC 11539 / FP-39264 / Madison 617) TaxID=670483 RepID=S7RNG5_GLOTA|nr:uncharacterized protein GLOTRDRAFT_93508 [Gloeophyllum trabeum ATCC 11539]EPQ56010.1 hypothetical protein GLOTRDRAFT_93508 [Gloeophyllum trabeum ATCC 11539]